MAAFNYFDHDNLRGEGPSDRADAHGYSCPKDFGDYYTEGVAENIWTGWLYQEYLVIDGAIFLPRYLSVETIASWAIESFMESPGHRDTILDGGYDRAAIGVAVGQDDAVYVTQNFC